MRVQSLDQLAFGAAPGKRLAVLGDPVAHSLSPAMHNAALRRMAAADPELAGWEYTAIHVAGGRLAGALEALHAAGVYGINLTLPHKVSALELVEEIDAAVRPMGAVNTLTRTATGYRATNTDGYGIRKAIAEAFGVELAGRDVWVFGAGGAARGIVVACLQGGCARLTVVNRSEPRLRELEQQVRCAGMAEAARARFVAAAQARCDADSGAILINATALGLKAADPSPLPTGWLGGGARVYDTTYGAANQLARACAQRGIPYADGLSMLVWQGVRSLHIWTGREVPAETMRQAALEQLKERTRHG
jgi:shikimate dehydrogenase